MDNYHERFNFLKDLYERKFYQENKVSGALEKVLNFQKKIQEFKINKPSSSKNSNKSFGYFLDEEDHQFRPMTNISTSHSKRQKRLISPEGKKIQVPTEELRIILDRKSTGEMNILTENLRNRNLFSVNEHRKKQRLLSHRQSIREQPEPISRLSKGNLSKHSHQRNISRSQRRVTPISINLISKQNQVISKQNQEDVIKKSRTASKKVFIGGRDLEKAAEEYYKHFKEMNKNIDKMQQLRNKKQVNPMIKRNSYDKKLRTRQLSKRSKQKQLHLNKKNESTKTEPKHMKNDSFMLNLQLNPWNVGDHDYP